MSLFKVDKYGNTHVVLQEKAQSGRFFISPSTDQLLIKLFLSWQKIKAIYVMTAKKGKINSINMPVDYQDGSLKSAHFYADENHIALRFEDKAALGINISTGEIKSLVDVSMPPLLSKSLHDPLTRVIADISDGKLLLQAIPGQPLICPKLAGLDANTAAFSPDGKLIAIENSSGSELTVYDLETCSVIYKTNIKIIYSNRLLFTSSNILWVIGTHGEIKIFNVKPDLSSIHERAKHLRKELGLGLTKTQANSQQ